MGQTKKDLRELPDEVQAEFGLALREVQKRMVPEGAVPMKGHLRDVIELRANYEGDTYRMMFTGAPDAIYVLHTFKKKSKRGSQTPREEIHRITARLKRVRTLNRSEESQP